jgi:hypothetical protein
MSGYISYHIIELPYSQCSFFGDNNGSYECGEKLRRRTLPERKDPFRIDSETALHHYCQKIIQL